MTKQTKTTMVVQALAFAVYWPAAIDLSYDANHPPLSVLVAAAGLSLLLGVAYISANLVRDRCMQDPIAKSLYNSFQFFAIITSLTIISAASATCKVLRMPQSERGVSPYVIYIMLFLVGMSVVSLMRSVFNWWLTRHRAE
jgi:hypothetical protein